MRHRSRRQQGVQRHRLRYRIRFICNALVHADKSGRYIVSTFIATAFAQDDAEGSVAPGRRLALPQATQTRRLL